MSSVQAFTFNPYSENTFIVFDESKECSIFDPGCHTPQEQKTLTDFIEENSLKPVQLINTHGHIDHMLGNDFVANKYGLGLQIHQDEVEMLNASPRIGETMGITVVPSPAPTHFIEDGDKIVFGTTEFEAILAPGHSVASLCFYNDKSKFLIGGDVLFQMSIGRTDLPGGDYETLMKSIFTRLLVLDDDVVVYPGHGEPTTIGFERKNNPFILERV